MVQHQTDSSADNVTRSVQSRSRTAGREPQQSAAARRPRAAVSQLRSRRGVMGPGQLPSRGAGGALESVPPFMNPKDKRLLPVIYFMRVAAGGECRKKIFGGAGVIK